MENGLLRILNDLDSDGRGGKMNKRKDGQEGKSDEEEGGDEREEATSRVKNEKVAKKIKNEKVATLVLFHGFPGFISRFSGRRWFNVSESY